MENRTPPALVLDSLGARFTSSFPRGQSWLFARIERGRSHQQFVCQHGTSLLRSFFVYVDCTALRLRLDDSPHGIVTVFAGQCQECGRCYWATDRDGAYLLEWTARGSQAIRLVIHIKGKQVTLGFDGALDARASGKAPAYLYPCKSAQGRLQFVIGKHIASLDYFQPFTPGGYEASLSFGEALGLFWAIRKQRFLLHHAPSELWRDWWGDCARGWNDVPCDLLAWRDGAIPRLAEHIRAENDFGAIPVLADMLEEAGSGDAALLAHLRTAEHCAGCEALSAMAEKSTPG